MEAPLFVAFVGTRHLATGPAVEVLRLAAPYHTNAQGPLLIFEHASGRQVDFDWRDPQPPAPTKPGPGRPKLGVVSTEVTLLPRHWDWLATQPARASGTLRRLVEDAMAREASDPRKRAEALAKILWAVAGNEPGFEEANRALYAADKPGLNAIVQGWSGDLAHFVATWT